MRIKLVLYAIVALILAAIALPNFIPARVIRSESSITTNLRIIESAKKSWALANNKQATDPVSLADLTAYFKNNQPPQPVLGETYQVSTVAESPIAILPEGKILLPQPAP